MSAHRLRRAAAMVGVLCFGPKIVSNGLWSDERSA